MPKLREWLIRLWQTLRPGRDDRDLEQELRTHRELAADDARRRADSPNGAARAARVHAGPLAPTMDALRDQHSVPWLRDLGHDLRYTGRTLRTSPSFSMVAVLTLGLGIGVNTAIFSLTDAVLFKPLPGIHNADRLVALYSDNRETDIIEYQGFPYPDYLALRELDDVLVDLTAFVRLRFVLTGSLGTAPVVGDLVSGSYFSVFGAVPEEGRLLNEGDDAPGTSPVAVISYRLWQERFGGRLPIVGETLTLDQVPLTVVGVAPRGFRGSLLDWYGDTPIDVFAPYWVLERVLPGPRGYSTDRSWVGPQLIGRLQPGVPVEVARTALVARVGQLATAFPDTNADRAVIVLPSDQARFWPGRYGQTVRLVALLNISALVLLGIACFNLANLLLTRTLARRREIGLRLAIGATRSRLIRQLLVEVMLLTLAGGLVGARCGVDRCAGTGCLSDAVRGAPVPRTPPRRSCPALHSRAVGGRRDRLRLSSGPPGLAPLADLRARCGAADLRHVASLGSPAAHCVADRGCVRPVARSDPVWPEPVAAREHGSRLHDGEPPARVVRGAGRGRRRCRPSVLPRVAGPRGSDARGRFGERRHRTTVVATQGVCGGRR